MGISVVVPCYNEQDNIASLVKAFLPLTGKDEFELVLVDNGSSDNTRIIIMELAKVYEFIKLVKIDKNIGYGNGIFQGLKAAKGDLLGWIHADLQFSPLVLKEMIDVAKLIDVPFLFKGNRVNRPLIDRMFTRAMSIFETIYLRTRMNDINGQPTLINRKFLALFENVPNDFSFDLYVYYLAKKRNIRIERFPSIQNKRLFGESSWNTGFLSRYRLIKRTIIYSYHLKRRL